MKLFFGKSQSDWQLAAAMDKECSLKLDPTEVCECRTVAAAGTQFVSQLKAIGQTKQQNYQPDLIIVRRAIREERLVQL